MLPPLVHSSTSDVEYVQLKPLHGRRGKGSIHASPLITPSTTPESSVSKSNFLIRVVSFALLEAGFLIFAYKCLTRPIPLRTVSPDASLVYTKAVTAISVVWHTLAAVLIKDIISYVFSAECMAQHHRSGLLKPGKTDEVSRITSGQLTQAKHFISQAATLRYRLAFGVVVLLIALGPLGAGVISANTASFDSPTEIRLANLPIVANTSIFALNQTQAMDRANIITRLEQLENNTYGYQSPQEGILIPWPQFNQSVGNASVIYESDVITYNMGCEWKDVTPNNGSLLVPFGGNDMLEWRIREARVIPGAAALSQYGPVVTGLIQPDEVVSGDPSRGALLAFLFVGNSSVPDPPLKKGSIYLNGLPTFPMSSVNLGSDLFGTSFSTIFNGSVLLCDPKPVIVRATATLAQNSLTATLSKGTSLVGNIHTSAANIIFARSLLDAAQPAPGADINPVAMLLLMGPPDEAISNSTGIRPLQPDQIAMNIDNVLRSSSKAYLSGWKLNDTFLSFASYDTSPQSATLRAPQPALVASKPFFVSLLVLVVVINLVLVSLVTISKPEEFQLLDLYIITKLSRHP